MNTKQRKRQRDIKTKLMAAICMLLVSSIMMVSTTYAWFTLSTAPEVTGINTAVGANGALEMALLPTHGDVNLISSNVGDSMVTNTAKAANITWGNLVDLAAAATETDADPYGLNQIKLMPARLNLESIVDAGVMNDETPLLTPKYGYDGRVDSLTGNTMANGLNDAGKFLATTSGINYGVRAVGSASSMSERELNYRNYRSAGSAASLNAQNKAASTLQANGQTLANMAIDHATGNDVFGVDEKQALLDVVNAMLGTDDTKVDGALEYIEESLRSYLLAAISSQTVQNSLDKTTYETWMTSHKNDSLATLLSNQELQDKMSTHLTTFSTLKSELDALVTKMNNAKTAINALVDYDSSTADVIEYHWEQMRPILTNMVDPAKMIVNGNTIDEVKADPNVLVNSYTSTGQLNLYLYDGAGIFADIAQFCGSYDTPVFLDVQYGSFHVPNLKAYMYAECATKNGETVTNNTPKLTTISNAVIGLKAPAAEIGGESPLTDFYGYILDLAFRTNAPDSNLMLQTAAKDRIYSDSDDHASETWGGGSYMTFKGTSGFDNDLVANLMKCINVVFFDKDSGTIYGIANLDLEKKTVDTNGVTAPLYMMNYTLVDNSGNKTITFTSVKGEEELKYVTGTPVYTAPTPAEGQLPTPDYTTGKTITTKVPNGVTVSGFKTAATGAAYTFTLTGLKTSGVEYTVTYSIDGASAQPMTAASGVYTIPADVITTGITTIAIEVTATTEKALLLTGDTDTTPVAPAAGEVDVTAIAPIGVSSNGASVATKYVAAVDSTPEVGADYTFTLTGLTANSTYTVTYKVGADGEEVVLTATGSNTTGLTYTIPKTAITDAITIQVNERKYFDAEGDIVELVQNVAKTVSVLVYLDGDRVTNADVANAATSMTGTMNLQFSSSATLVPMEYTPLMDQGTPATTETQAQGSGT